jgi:hypothetical protein
VAEIRQAKAHTYNYGMFKNLKGTSGAAGVRDTFFGPRDKAYVDFHARNDTRVRGINAYYYVLEDENRRIDGDKPLSNSLEGGRIDVPEKTEPDPWQRKAHAGSALYGENIKIGRRIDSVRREVIPDWPYLDPILVRGVVYEVEHEEEADERGVIYVRRATIDLARVLCDKEWEFQPRNGDVIRFPKLLDQYMNVREVDRDERRWGGDGFFAIYKVYLEKTSKYEPQRKIAERKLTDSPPDGHVDDNPGQLS